MTNHAKTQQRKVAKDLKTMQEQLNTITQQMQMFTNSSKQVGGGTGGSATKTAWWCKNCGTPHVNKNCMACRACGKPRTQNGQPPRSPGTPQKAQDPPKESKAQKATPQKTTEGSPGKPKLCHICLADDHLAKECPFKSPSRAVLRDFWPPLSPELESRASPGPATSAPPRARTQQWRRANARTRKLRQER